MKKYNFDEINISMLFDKEPEIGWAARGNPHLWDEMRLKSKNIKLLENEEKMKNYFYNLFEETTSISILENKPVKINRYLLDSGMSNGVVTGYFWREEFIPILLKRYRKIKYFDNYEDLIDNNQVNEYFNSIENAINRIFMFYEININNLLELLSMDDNVNKISEKMKKEIMKTIKAKIEDENISKMVVKIINEGRKTAHNGPVCASP